MIKQTFRRWGKDCIYIYTSTTYRNTPKNLDTQTNCCDYPIKIATMCFYHRMIQPNDADWMANSVGPDQTAPLGAVWSGSILFAQTCLSENLGSLGYLYFTGLFESS